MNNEELYQDIYNLINKYIKVYKNQNSDKSDEDLLEDLRSWSSLENGISVYINSSDLMPEFKLSGVPYASVRFLGIEINISQGRVGSVKANLLGDDGEYGLPDLKAVIDYVSTHLETNKNKDLKLSRFFIENTVVVGKEDRVSIGSIKEHAEMEVKANILDSLLSRKDVSFNK